MRACAAAGAVAAQAVDIDQFEVDAQRLVVDLRAFREDHGALDACSSSRTLPGHW
jgi:hypothetical protein